MSTISAAKFQFLLSWQKYIFKTISLRGLLNKLHPLNGEHHRFFKDINN